MKFYHYIIAIALFFLGVYVGNSFKEKEQVPVIGKVTPTLVDSVRPENPVLPMKPIRIKDTVYMAVDTAKIIDDYIMAKKYSDMLFNNDYGKLTVTSSIQYNKLTSLDYTFIPKTKRTFIPYARGSASTFGIIGLGGGFIYNNLGVDIQYQTDFSKNGFEIGLNYYF